MIFFPHIFLKLIFYIVSLSLRRFTVKKTTKKGILKGHNLGVRKIRASYLSATEFRPGLAFYLLASQMQRF